MSSPYDNLDVSEREGMLDTISDYSPSTVMSCIALWIESRGVDELEHLSVGQQRKLHNTISGLALNLERMGL